MQLCLCQCHHAQQAHQPLRRSACGLAQCQLWHDTLSLVLCLAGGSMRSSRPKLSQSLVRMRRRRMPSMPRSRSPAQRKRQLHPIGSRWQRMLIMNQSSVCSCATWNEVCLHIPGVAHFFQSDGGSRNEMLGNR